MQNMTPKFEEVSIGREAALPNYGVDVDGKNEVYVNKVIDDLND